MKRARRAGTLAVAAALALACVSPTGDEPEQHWLDSLAWAYERGDCAGVRERAAEPPLRAGPWLKLAALLLAYCDEHALEFARARAGYEAIVRERPGSEAAHAARARLAEFARMDEGFAREVVWDRALSAPPIQPDRRPLPVSRGRLTYPSWLLRAGIEGWARVETVLDAAGTPGELAILDSWPPFLFEAAALDVVAGSRYRPPPVGHDPTRTWIVLVRFELRD